MASATAARGYEGGHWENGHMYYNTAVVNVGTTHITNTYVKNVNVNNVTINRVSYNGGSGGVQARPTAEQENYAKQPHVQPVAAQLQQRETAAKNPVLLSKANGGKPPIAATTKPGEFSGAGVVKARGAPEHPVIPPRPTAAEKAANEKRATEKAAPKRGHRKGSN